MGTPANAVASLSCTMAPSVQLAPNCVAFTSGKEGIKGKPHSGLTQVLANLMDPKDAHTEAGSLAKP